MPLDRGLDGLVRERKNPHDPLSHLIDRYFLQRRHSAPIWFPLETRLPPGARFTPTSSGKGKCQRAGVFKFMMVPGSRITEPDLQVIFEVGDWLHLMWYSILRDMERVLGPDTLRVVGVEDLMVLPSLYMIGHYDIVVEIEGKPYVIDLKTINDWGFQQVRKRGRPQPEHSTQVLPYMRAQKIPRAIVMYLNKNEASRFLPVVKFNQDEWKTMVRWVRRTVSYLEAREIPPMHPECTQGSQMQRNCPFSEICYNTTSLPKLRKVAYAGKPQYLTLWEETTAKQIEERRAQHEART